jgi:histone deacetylase 6
MHIDEVRRMTAAVAADPTNRQLREPDGPGGVYYSPHADAAARLACGCVIDATLDVIREAAAPPAKAPRGYRPVSFALVRPPGHHAGADDTPCHRAEGFCFYNSVAVAAGCALAQGVRKIAILDWDVHHGNGTQHIFEEDPNVLYVSLHRYGSGFFPGTGAFDEVGKAAGRGRTLNVPWLQAGLGDADYAAAFDLVIMPVLREFAPQLVLISAGFDAALGDIQGKMRMSPDGYARLTRSLFSLPECALVAVLEGGYHLEASAECAEAVLRVMLEEGERGRGGGEGKCGGTAADARSSSSSSNSRGTGRGTGRGGSSGTGSSRDGSCGIGSSRDGSCGIGSSRDGSCGGRGTNGSGVAGSLGTHTELLLRQVLDVQREFWQCLREPAHALEVEAYFRQPAGRKRGRSDI